MNYKIKHRQNYNYWQKRAEENKTLFDMSSNDPVLGRLEIKALKKHLPTNCKVLEIGCAAGRVFKGLVKTHPNFYFGIDFSEAMIEKAISLKLQNCNFEIRNMLSFKKDNFFDVVFTVRGITNLLDPRDQLKMIKVISNCLKKNGKVILLEPTKQGLDQINRFRNIAGLKTIVAHEFNRYLDLKSFLSVFRRFFNFEIIEFASSYYLSSRLFNAFVAKIESRPMKYDDPINLLGAKLPIFCDIAPHKMIVGKKIPERSGKYQ